MTSTTATTDAGTGTTITQGDAGVAAPDAPPDAPTQGLISIVIEGKGYVELRGIGTCDSDAPQNGQCQFTVPLELSVTADANASDDWRFDRWTTSACPDEDDETCTFVPAVTMQLGAKFRKD